MIGSVLCGQVTLSKLNPGFQWRSTMNIADTLVAVRENMKNGKVCSASAALAGSSY